MIPENEWHKFFDFVRLLSVASFCYALIALKYNFPGPIKKIKIPVLTLSSLVFIASSWILYTRFAGKYIVYSGRYDASSKGFLWIFVFLLVFALIYPKSKLKKEKKK